MFIDLTESSLQPIDIESDVPEIHLSASMRSCLQDIFSKEEKFAKINSATSVVKPDSNSVFFSNQWFYLAVICKKYAQALYPYCTFFDSQIRNNQELMRFIISGNTDDPQFTSLFETEEDKNRMLQFIQGDSDFRPGKALINIREGNKVTARSCKDIFGSCVLKKISVPDASSGYLGTVIFYLAKYNAVYEELAIEIAEFIKEYQSSKESEDNSDIIENMTLELKRLTTGTNILLYGVPGSGKSYTIQKEYCSDESRMERLVFHPDYTYSDFIGQILPDVSEGSVTYRFTPGPFTSILKKAYENPEQEYFLIIEEINRGNAPAIFGEVFQLLDRKEEIDSENDDDFPIGTSEYGISNTNIAAIVYGDPTHKVRIPSNLSIIGTMNTSDQNVFTLDTAFQRRWSMRMVNSSFANVAPDFRNHPILDTTITWEGFCDGINTIILQKNARITSSEDKRLGPYFIHKSDLIFDADEDNDQLSETVRMRARRNNSRFAEKVLKYLWDDAFKFSRSDVFRMDSYYSLEQVIHFFVTHRGDDRFSMFTEDIVDRFRMPHLN